MPDRLRAGPAFPCERRRLRSATLGNSSFMSSSLIFGPRRAISITRFGALNRATAARTSRADGFVSLNADSPPAPKLGAFRLCGAVKMIP
jgi:hypothetical protein